MKESVTAIEIWEIEKILPYAANAKKHPKEQIDKLATAITKFGWTQPIVVWQNGEIIAGHGRRLAALQLGLKKVPVIVRRDLTRAEADALRLADNRVVSTDYDQLSIQEELRRLAPELMDLDINLMDLGFDAKEVDFSLSDLGAIEEDFFVEDVGAAVEKQKKENTAAEGRTDNTAAPITDALGIKRVTIRESRTLRGLMVQVEEKTGKKGIDALISALEKSLSD